MCHLSGVGVASALSAKQTCFSVSSFVAYVSFVRGRGCFHSPEAIRGHRGKATFLGPPHENSIFLGRPGYSEIREKSTILGPPHGNSIFLGRSEYCENREKSLFFGPPRENSTFLGRPEYRGNREKSTLLVTLAPF